MRSQLLLFLVCIGGIYTSFLTWGVLQEELSSHFYGSEQFKAPFFISLVQSLLAAVVGYLYVLFTSTSMNSTISVFQPSLLKSITLVALTQSLSSPVGLMSVQYVDYLLYQLAKSCKLIPVLVVHTVWYKRVFPLYKYLVASAVTLGVVLFTMGNKEVGDHDHLLMGILLLSGSLLLDGITNATQDNLFKRHRELTGAHLMFGLNLVGFILGIGYCLANGQLIYSLDFINRHPLVLKEIFVYSICGALGQVFIFLTLSKFGSIVLIMVTVTRKMVSMLLSVVLFGHKLVWTQWAALGLVFAGIAYEALVKLMDKPKQNIENPKKE